MTQYEKRKIKAREKLEIYEKNLQSWYESLRRTLDTQLSSSMPHQVGTIKTILWVNLLFLGLGFQVMKDRPFVWDDLFLLLPVAASVFALLTALIFHRHKWYGDRGDIDFPHTLYDSKFPRTDLLSALLKDAKTAVDGNSKIMRSIARHMHFSLWSTLLAGVGLAVLVISHNPAVVTKGETNMSQNEKPKPPSQVPAGTRPAHENKVERGITDRPKPAPKQDDSKK